MWGFFGVEPFARDENPLETECSDASTGRILVSSKRLRLCGGLSVPAPGCSLLFSKALGLPRVLNDGKASVPLVLNAGIAEERRRRRRRVLGGGDCSSAVGDGRVEGRLCWSRESEVDACNTTGGIELDGVGEEVSVLLERFGAVEVDGSSVMIGEGLVMESSARSKWRQSRHFWSCGHSWVLLTAAHPCSSRKCLPRSPTRTICYGRVHSRALDGFRSEPCLVDGFLIQLPALAI